MWRRRRRRGVPVVNVPGASAESVAELAIALMLGVSRKIKYIDQGLQQGELDRFGRQDMVGA
jgi:phosphoglycerate dehydrogenase-like enzyme